MKQENDEKHHVGIWENTFPFALTIFAAGFDFLQVLFQHHAHCTLPLQLVVFYKGTAGRQQEKRRIRTSIIIVCAICSFNSHAMSDQKSSVKFFGGSGWFSMQVERQWFALSGNIKINSRRRASWAAGRGSGSGTCGKHPTAQMSHNFQPEIIQCPAF